MHRVLLRRVFLHQLRSQSAYLLRTGVWPGLGYIYSGAPIVAANPRQPPRLRGYATRDGPALLTRRDDTIYALSTPEGKAGIAVIRISGPACKSVRGFPCEL